MTSASSLILNSTSKRNMSLQSFMDVFSSETESSIRNLSIFFLLKVETFPE